MEPQLLVSFVLAIALMIALHGPSHPVPSGRRDDCAVSGEHGTGSAGGLS